MTRPASDPLAGEAAARAREMLGRAFGPMLKRPEDVAGLYETARQAAADLDHISSWLMGFAAALPEGPAARLGDIAEDLDYLRRNLRDAVAAEGTDAAGAAGPTETPDD